MQQAVGYRVHEMLAIAYLDWLQKGWTRRLHAQIQSFYCLETNDNKIPVGGGTWGVTPTTFWPWGQSAIAPIAPMELTPMVRYGSMFKLTILRRYMSH